MKQRGVVAVGLDPQACIPQAAGYLSRTLRVSGLVVLAGDHESGLFHLREVLLHVRAGQGAVESAIPVEEFGIGIGVQHEMSHLSRRVGECRLAEGGLY